MTERLKTALNKITSMRAPSVGDVLRRRGFGYEAECMDELVAAWDDFERD